MALNDPHLGILYKVLISFDSVATVLFDFTCPTTLVSLFQVTLDCLHPGILYKVVVEAVVSVKTTLKSQVKDPEGEKMNRRTTHVMSRPLFVRTRAPCEPPKPIVTGYTQNSIQLYWEKPLLYSVIGKDDNGNPKYLKYSLEGYR